MDWKLIVEFALGSIPAILAVGAFMLRLDRRLNTFMIEHELLMGWYSEKENKPLASLPTRSKRFM